MSHLAELESLTKAFAAEHDVLSGRVQHLVDELEASRRRLLPGIKKAVALVAETRDKLKAFIEAHPDLFVQPRTLVLSGVKVGLAKGVGSLDYDDEDQVIRLIEKHFPDLADVLIKVKKSLSKKALEGLEVAELKKLGVTVEETGDRVVIKPTDGGVGKVLKALLKDAEGEAEEARKEAA